MDQRLLAIYHALPARFRSVAASLYGYRLRRDRWGLTISPGDGEGLAAAILELAGDPAQLAELGRNARAAFERRYAMTVALGRWRRLLADVEGTGGLPVGPEMRPRSGF